MPNKLYLQEETDVVFGSEVGDDVAWSTEGIANNAGRQSALYDLGAPPRAAELRYRFYTQLQATPTVGQAIRLYKKTAAASAAHPDNDDGTGDAAVSAENKLLNLDIVDQLKVDEAAADVEMVRHGLTVEYSRQIGWVFWNESGASTTADAAETKLIMTPVPPEIQ